MEHLGTNVFVEVLEMGPFDQNPTDAGVDSWSIGSDSDVVSEVARKT